MACKETTPSNIKNEGRWENDRNAANRDLFSRILREVYGQDDDTLIAHHLCYSMQVGDQFIVQEIPAADTLIFDHGAAKVLWGADWEPVLMRLALEPVETRDALLGRLYDYPHRGESGWWATGGKYINL